MARPTPIYISRRQIRVQSLHTRHSRSKPFAFGEVGRRFGEVAAFLIQDESQGGSSIPFLSSVLYGSVLKLLQIANLIMSICD